MIGTWPAGIPNLMALNSSPAIEVLRYRGLHALQNLRQTGRIRYNYTVHIKYHRTSFLVLCGSTKYRILGTKN